MVAASSPTGNFAGLLMATVLNLRATKRTFRRRAEHALAECEIVIFPGVRIERHEAGADLDLSFRLLDAAGPADYEDFTGNHRPRRTS